MVNKSKVEFPKHVLKDDFLVLEVKPNHLNVEVVITKNIKVFLNGNRRLLYLKISIIVYLDVNMKKKMIFIV